MIPLDPEKPTPDPYAQKPAADPYAKMGGSSQFKPTKRGRGSKPKKGKVKQRGYVFHLPGGVFKGPSVVRLGSTIRAKAVGRLGIRKPNQAQNTLQSILYGSNTPPK